MDLSDLPDFVPPDDLLLGADAAPLEQTWEPSPSASRSASPAAAGKLDALGFDRPSDPPKPPSSEGPIVRDKSLESSFTFDAVSKPLPKAKEVLSKKRDKRKALSRSGEAEDTRSFAQRFAPKEESGEVSGGEGLPSWWLGRDANPLRGLTAIQIVEKLTWGAIFVLVAWEAYINSPLFERAAPMAPVVY
ncbi:hypothetical protein TeGR_g2846 [Tetraparma gracilis]|uniref:Uncharacterized protein n=1 Tax=Tetraparma gracilis TaxID=2962635 RepID=A0ABQ6MK01_9STRA|nr:hypothetical protein TeGR_g2846 [Tetraparma gracilis]